MIVVESTCYATSSVNILSENGLECANGNFVSSWNGCIDQGSFRVRCPKEYFPCNGISYNGKEFACKHDCTQFGGFKHCLVEGTLFVVHF